MSVRTRILFLLAPALAAFLGKVAFAPQTPSTGMVCHMLWFLEIAYARRSVSQPPSLRHLSDVYRPDLSVLLARAEF